MKSFLVPLGRLAWSLERKQCNCIWPNFQTLKLTCFKCNRVREGLDRYKRCLLTGILFEVVITDSEFELISDPSEICLACRLNEMNVCKTESTHDTWYIAVQNIIYKNCWCAGQYFPCGDLAKAMLALFLLWRLYSLHHPLESFCLYPIANSQPMFRYLSRGERGSSRWVFF